MTPQRLDVDELESRAGFAQRLAQAAGDAILPHFRARIDIGNKHGGAGFDPVTEADRAAERAMRAMIENAYPDDGILGEEFPEKPSRNGLKWVLDPVDGTRAFIAGLPSWGVLIALNDGARPVLGAIAQPYIGELFLGISSEQVRRATLNGAPIRCRQGVALEDAIITTTGTDFMPEDDRRGFEAVAARTRLTRFGYDCYAYAVLAAGFIDLVIESGLETYDVQALIPVIEGAGGIVTTWTGDDAQHGGRVLAAGCRRLHDAAREILAGASP